ncbi:MAG: hypothetical protein Kow00107_05130 [Planctomycetota bacterium]
MNRIGLTSVFLLILFFCVGSSSAEEEEGVRWRERFVSSLLESTRDVLRSGDRNAVENLIAWICSTNATFLHEAIVEEFERSADESLSPTQYSWDDTFSKYADRILAVARKHRFGAILARYGEENDLPVLEELLETSPEEEIKRIVNALCWREQIPPCYVKLLEKAAASSPDERTQVMARTRIAIVTGKPCDDFEKVISSPFAAFGKNCEKLLKVIEDNWSEAYLQALEVAAKPDRKYLTDWGKEVNKFLIRKFPDYRLGSDFRYLGRITQEDEELLLDYCARTNDYACVRESLRSQLKGIGYDGKLPFIPKKLLFKCIEEGEADEILWELNWRVIPAFTCEEMTRLVSATFEVSSNINNFYLPYDYWSHLADWIASPECKLRKEDVRSLCALGVNSQNIPLKDLRKLVVICSERTGDPLPQLEPTKGIHLSGIRYYRWRTELLCETLGRKIGPQDQGYFYFAQKALTEGEDWLLDVCDVLPALEEPRLGFAFGKGLLRPEFADRLPNLIETLKENTRGLTLLDDRLFKFHLGDAQTVFSEGRFEIRAAKGSYLIVQLYPNGLFKILGSISKEAQIVETIADDRSFSVVVTYEHPYSPGYGMEKTDKGWRFYVDLDNPRNLDSDTDGITDEKERNYRLDPYNPDCDKDGVVDGMDPTPLFVQNEDLLPLGLVSNLSRFHTPSFGHVESPGIYSMFPVQVPLCCTFPATGSGFEPFEFSLSERPGWVDFHGRFRVTKRNGKFVLAPSEHERKW